MHTCVTLRHLLGLENLAFHLPAVCEKVDCRSNIGLHYSTCPDVCGHSHLLKSGKGSKQLFLHGIELLATMLVMCEREGALYPGSR